MKGQLGADDQCVPLCGRGTAGHSLKREGKGQFRHLLVKLKTLRTLKVLKFFWFFFPEQGLLLKHKEVEQMCLVGVEVNLCCETLDIKKQKEKLNYLQCHPS